MDSKSARIRPATLIMLTAMLVAGCKAGGNGPNNVPGIRVLPMNPADLTAPADDDRPITLSAARNEWTELTVQIDGLSQLRADAKRSPRLRVKPLKHVSGNAQIGAENLTAYQVVAMPIDVNRAGYVRHTGMTTTNKRLPRALLPLPTENGLVDLSAARDPNHATDPQSRATGSSSGPLHVWLDLHVPPDAAPGEYSTTIELIEHEGKARDNPRAIADTKLNVTVFGFVLPDERHLMMVGPVEWEDLTRLYPTRFEAVTPWLMNRNDPRYADAVKTLDQIVSLAQANRAQVVIPRLQPTVKWPTGKPPQIDWNDFDSIVFPWFKGEVFPDKQPIGYWPLPAARNLEAYDQKSQREYWAEAAAHFDQFDWLTRSVVVLRGATGGRVDMLEALKLSGDAAQILLLNPRLRVEVPLEDEQVQFANLANDRLVRRETADRLITANPGLVFSSPAQTWPADVPRPARWLRTDLTGLIPYVGAGGDQRDVRLWAWFASVPLPPPQQLGVQYGPVRHVRWPGALPKASNPEEPADPSELVWFYPGTWFGIDRPVPSVQLKWLRRAQQDFEYIHLARQRGVTVNALVMARLLSKPVELQPAQQPDPTYGLMSGTADPTAWRDALNLLAQHILLREPGQTPDPRRGQALNTELLHWLQPQERPVVLARSATWFMDTSDPGVPRVHVVLGIDVYNAADRTPDRNQLEFSEVPKAWHYSPYPQKVDQLGTYHVTRATCRAIVEPTEVRNATQRPVELTFTDGFTKQKSSLKLMLPVGISERREGRLNINGSLEDWTPDDAVQDGPLVNMFNRPALQKQELQLATTPSQVFSGWGEENLYLAFRVSGLSGADSRAARNFVTYQLGRAWGEDLIEVLAQPIFADHSSGPVLHIVCKPNGGSWVERKMDPKQFANPWQAFEGTGIRYAATVDSADWRGEVAIPWKALVGDDPKKGRPVMLRFNFSQHKTVTGETASWAGPVDSGRDGDFTGILLIREPNNPGMAGF